MLGPEVKRMDTEHPKEQGPHPTPKFQVLSRHRLIGEQVELWRQSGYHRVSSEKNWGKWGEL